MEVISVIMSIVMICLIIAQFIMLSTLPAANATSKRVLTAVHLCHAMADGYSVWENSLKTECL